MKTTITLNVTRKEIDTIKSMLMSNYETVATSANIGTMIPDENKEAWVVDFKKAFEAYGITYSHKCNLSNLGYMFKLKDSLDIELTVDINPEAIALMAEYEELFFDTTFPLLDSVFGVFKAFGLAELAKNTELLNKRFKEMKGPVLKSTCTTTGNSVE